MGKPHRSRARRGAVIAAILGALEDGPNHGYGIMDKLESQSEGRWRPSPGSVYPALSRLESKGLVKADDSTDPKEFSLTDDGKKWLAERGTQEDAPWAHAEGPGLRSAMSQLTGATKQLGRFGSDEQRKQALALIEEATTGMYALLAQKPSADEADTDTADDSVNES